jgi:hypothetical protein
MTDWLKAYLNWWGSQAQQLTEMTLIDFLVSIPIAFLPIILLMWFLGFFSKKKIQVGFDNPERSDLAKSIDER